MNYLAHIYLSNNEIPIQLGNFIADSIKGNTYMNYPSDIQVGILLHRQIDWFTDNNAIAKQSKRRLNERYGHYKGIIVDIFYDHFLAKNWKEYSEIELSDFAHGFYKVLKNDIENMPLNIQKMTPYLIEGDWLTSYASTQGIQNVLEGMNRRIGAHSKMDLAINDLLDQYENFENDFTLFFEDLSEFSTQKLIEIKNN